MNNLGAFNFSAALAALGLLSGCGTYVPPLQPFRGAEDVQTMVNAIVFHVQCEVQTAVQFLILDDIDAAMAARSAGFKQGRSVAWLDSWAAQVTLTLTVEEKTGLNPGIAFTPPLAPAITTFTSPKVTVTTPQTFSLSLGGNFSATASRKETLSWYIDFKKFTDQASLKRARVERNRLYHAARETGASPYPEWCNQGNGALIQSDLKLREWLYAATLPTFVRGGAIGDFSESIRLAADKAKKDVISHEITFAIVYGGSITPSWKLLRVSGNQGALPFLNLQRSPTQNLIITLGQATPTGVSNTAQATTLASQIGQAVATAIRATPP